jgi:hypothetical protein
MQREETSSGIGASLNDVVKSAGVGGVCDPSRAKHSKLTSDQFNGRRRSAL